MKWIGQRISFVEDKNKTTIVIYPESKAMIKALMGAWVSMWLTIGAIVVWSFFNFKLTEQEQLIIYIFMAFWVYYAIRVTRSFMWLMWGKELIKIDEAALIYKRSIRNYGKAIPYYHENIKKMSQSHPEANSIQSAWESSPWTQGGERLEFQYLGKMVRFARKISEKDSKLLFNLITKRIEEQLRKRK